MTQDRAHQNIMPCLDQNFEGLPEKSETHSRQQNNIQYYPRCKQIHV